MINYASFSPLKISVGKLLAGRYEILRSLRSDDFNFELLALDKAADDMPVALRLLPGPAGNGATDNVIVETAEGSFCFSVSHFSTVYFEQPEKEEEDIAAGSSILDGPDYLTLNFNPLAQRELRTRSWQNVSSDGYGANSTVKDCTVRRPAGVASRARRRKARIRKIKILLRASIRTAAGLTLLFAAVLLSLGFGHSAAAARRSGPIQAGQQQENSSAQMPAAESSPAR